MNNQSAFRRKLLASAIASCSLSAFGGMAYAQAPASQSPVVTEEVVVTGIRASLERSMDIKRDSAGVVDAITAEDMGKFPDTNLAESLQRITGVSIDRVNGEGSQVTVRGFGGGNNLVTLNGRHVPSANVAVIGGDQNADFAQGAGRSFDFSNLASEGISGIEVYKTGRASMPTGGIGATININTVKPLDNPGLNGSVGFKAVHDTTVYGHEGDKLTPELSGLFSWSDDDGRFGASLFASYQKRDSAAVSATVNGWNILPFRDFMNTDNGYVTANTHISNPPASNDQLVSIPNDSRWHLSEMERERINGMLTLQFRPMDNLTMTLDGFMAENSIEEQRSDQTNWFNRPFNRVGFDQNPVVATSVYLQETLSGVKDTGFEQQLRGMKDTMSSVGFNIDWEVNDQLTLTFDAHTSETESAPDLNGGAYSSVLFSMGAPVITSHSLDFRANDFPVQAVTVDDGVRSEIDWDELENREDDPLHPGYLGAVRDAFETDTFSLGTNTNGVLDAGDLGSQIARTVTSSQTTQLDQFSLHGSWDSGDFLTIDFGADHRAMEMNQLRTQTQQTLGDWGLNFPGDIPTDMVETICLACSFDDYNPRASGASLIAFRANALDLYQALSPIYAAIVPGPDYDPDDGVYVNHSVETTQREDNTVEEEITAIYAQATFQGELAGMDWSLLAGVRYEETDVTSTALVTPPAAIVWVSENDFVTRLSDESDLRVVTDSYDNILPSLDFSINLTQDVVARASWSKTISRPGYGSLFVADTAQQPPRATGLGGRPTGTAGNPGLEPLESTNIDLSVEWYYGDASYVSLGFFDKSVKNFEGSSVVNRPLYGLRDPSSGQPGTRSGAAVSQLEDMGVNISAVNMFVMTALLENSATPEAAVATFNDNYDGSNLNQVYVDSIIQTNEFVGNEDDPLYEFAVQTPINTETGNIYGFEFAIQHFFGDSGFGVQANYTMVNGDVGIDVGADPNVDQFALLGLSDSANFALLYEDYGFSGRLAYNWRDSFLDAVNRGADRNPVFVDRYAQLDMNVSYEVTDNIVVMFEGLNLTGENTRRYGRDYSNIHMMQEFGPRYMLGARYTF